MTTCRVEIHVDNKLKLSETGIRWNSTRKVAWNSGILESYSNIANTWRSQILQRCFVPSFIACPSLDVSSRRRKREWRLSSHERNRLRGNSFAVSLGDFIVHNELTFVHVFFAHRRLNSHGWKRKANEWNSELIVDNNAVCRLTSQGKYC